MITGFQRFADLDINPTEIIVRHLDETATLNGLVDIVTEVLPVEFIAAGNRIQKKIRQINPEAVICLGANAAVDMICLEKAALNLYEEEIPDNSSKWKIILSDGPPAYRSTLPFELSRNALQSWHIPVTLSIHAGTYLCNQGFYLACHEIERLRSHAKCGFIHVPLMSEQIKNGTTSSANLPFNDIFTAIRIMSECPSRDSSRSCVKETVHILKTNLSTYFLKRHLKNMI